MRVFKSKEAAKYFFDAVIKLIYDNDLIIKYDGESSYLLEVETLADLLKYQEASIYFDTLKWWMAFDLYNKQHVDLFEELSNIKLKEIDYTEFFYPAKCAYLKKESGLWCASQQTRATIEDVLEEQLISEASLLFINRPGLLTLFIGRLYDLLQSNNIRSTQVLSDAIEACTMEVD